MVELRSCHRSLPASTPLSSYNCGKSVRVLRYGLALRAFRDIVANAGHRPEHFSLRSLRIGGATTLAAGGDFPEVAIQREGGWRSDVFKIYTRNNMANSRLVSRKLGDASRGVERHPGEGPKFSLVQVMQRKPRVSLGVVKWWRPFEALVTQAFYCMCYVLQ